MITTAIAYTLGIIGMARLRPRFASLVGLSEVLFAVLGAWVLIGEAITPMQAIGGAVVLLGLALARQGDRTEKVAAPADAHRTAFRSRIWLAPLALHEILARDLAPASARLAAIAEPSWPQPLSS